MELLRKLTSSHAETGMKARQADFTRGGPLSPDFVVSLLLYLVSEGRGIGYRHVMNAFWDNASTMGLDLPTTEPVSGPAFCRARRKLRSNAVLSLVREVGLAFDRDHGSEHRFRGRRLLAVDGAKIQTCRSVDLWAEFDGPEQSFVPHAMVSTLYDVLGKVPLDATVTGYRGNERHELIKLLGSTRAGDVVILDRGYPSYEVLGEILSRGVDFVVRVPFKGTFPAVEKFVESGAEDARLVLESPERQARGPFNVRAVRRNGPEDEPQIYLTSLKRSEFPRSAIIDVYSKRWEVETLYGLIQAGSLNQQQYHAKTPDGVRQEVFATLLYVGLTRTLMAAAASCEDVEYDQISMKGAVLAVGRYLTRLLLSQTKAKAHAALDAVVQQIARVRDKKRPGRSFPRVSYKPQPRWTPRGRAGVTIG